jgi:hypothetical protein
MKSIILAILILVPSSVFADVWTAERNWNEKDIERFSKWIQSDSYNPNIFSESGPYKGIKTDCADAIIAAKVIFSYENKLNFKLKTSSYNTDIISQEINKFDHIDDQLEKVKSFIHYLGSSIGTEALARFNSYPISPKDIMPSDFYVSRWTSNGKFVRHAYMIKNVLPTGHLTLYSSTTPVKERELDVREGMPLHILSGSPWGFKRFLPLEINFDTPSDYSDDQYDFLREAGEDFFFSRVLDELKVEEDTLDLNLKRRVKNLCSQLKVRKREVLNTQRYLRRISNRCMNYSEYEEHSTPSRDKSLLNGIKRLMYGWKKIRKSEHVSKVSSEVVIALDHILRKNDSSEARESLNKLCKIDLTLKENEVSFNLKNFFDLMLQSRISSHPNDSYEKRWGLRGKITHCSSF